MPLDDLPDERGAVEVCGRISGIGRDGKGKSRVWSFASSACVDGSKEEDGGNLPEGACIARCGACLVPRHSISGEVSGETIVFLRALDRWKLSGRDGGLG